jgi:hypothetical protein
LEKKAKAEDKIVQVEKIETGKVNTKLNMNTSTNFIEFLLFKKDKMEHFEDIFQIMRISPFHFVSHLIHLGQCCICWLERLAERVDREHSNAQECHISCELARV